MIDLREQSTKKFLILLTVIFLVVLKLNNLVSYFAGFVNITLPFIIGIVIAFLLNRPMKMIKKLLLKTKILKEGNFVNFLAIILAYVLFIIIMYIFFSFVIPELIYSISLFFKNSDTYLNNLTAFLVKIENEFKIFENIEVNQIIKYLRDILSSTWALVGPQIFSFTNTFISSFFNSVIAIIFSIYLLISKDEIFKVLHRILSAYTPEKTYKKTVEVCNIINDTFNKYVIGQLLEALLIGSLCFVGMLLFRFEYPVLISVIVGATSFIPLFGAFFGGAVAFVLLLMISPTQAFYFVVFLTILQQVESNLLYPQLIGSSLGLPPILVLFAVIVGGNIMGLAGMLIGVPITTVIYILVKKDLKKKDEEKMIS